MQRFLSWLILLYAGIGLIDTKVHAAVPDWVVYPGNEWQTITPEEAGLDVASWKAYVDDKRKNAAGHPMAGHNTQGLHGVVWTRGGYIIDSIGDPDLKTLQSASVGKAFNKIALQLAIDLGYIDNANDLIQNYWTGAGQLDRKAKQMNQGHHKTLTFQHLATMKGGFPVSNGHSWNNKSGIPSWANWSGDATYDNYAHRAPGTSHYSSGGMWRLMQALTAVTGRDMKEFLDTELFSKIGIKASNWSIASGKTMQNDRDYYPDWPGYGDFCDAPYTIGGKTVYGGGGWVTMSPKDLARIGLLVATKGVWKGQQLITGSSLVNGHDGYGNSKMYGNKDNYVAIGMVAMDNIPYGKVHKDINDRVIGDVTKGGGTTPTPDDNDVPVAAFTYTVNNLEVNVNGSDSSDSDGNIASYTWAFGDGNSGSGKTASHTYATNGDYKIKLTVADNEGATKSKTITVTIGEESDTTPPVVWPSDSPYPKNDLKLWLGYQGAEVNGEGRVDAWRDFSGNKADATFKKFSNSPSKRKPSFNASNNGSAPYLQFRNFADNGKDGESLEGSIGEVKDYLTVFIMMRWDGGNPAHAEYSFSVGPEKNGGWGQGHHVSVSKEGQNYYCMWGFPSGEPGHYRGGKWGKDWHVQTVRIRPVAENENLRTWVDGAAQYKGRNYELKSGQDFVNDGHFALGRWMHQNYPWHGNVSIAEVLVYNRELSESDMRKVESTMKSRFNNYDGSGAPNPNPDPEPEPENQRPVAAYSYTHDGLSISVDASGSSDSDGNIVSYAWDFGDGNSGSGKTANHTFAAEGDYQVKVTVTDNDGASRSKTKTVTVTAPEGPSAENLIPYARWSYTIDGLTIQVDASNSLDEDGSIVAYAWDFGDGKTSTKQSLSHTYVSEGDFKVSLTVTDNDGGQRTKRRTLSIVAPTDPTPEPSPDNLAPMSRWSYDIDGLTVHVDGTKSIDEDGSVVSYAWDFGDGSVGTKSVMSHTYKSAGDYKVGLRVMDDMGDVQTKNRTLTLTGEPTSSAVDVYVLEAEEAKLNGSEVIQNKNASGGAYVDYDLEPGSYVQWTIDLPAGDYDATLHYANGRRFKLDMLIKVNGANAGEISLPSTESNWTNFTDSELSTISVDGGPTKVRVQTVEMGPNLDYMTLTPLSQE